MKLKEIVSCYVRERVRKPEDMARLRRSFVENGFTEESIAPGHWLYKRGAAFALTFDYQSEAIEIQIYLREIGDELEISVGNWGFPFEPTLSKQRYVRTHERVKGEISSDGALQINPVEVKEVERLAKEKQWLAVSVVLIVVAVVVLGYSISLS